MAALLLTVLLNPTRTWALRQRLLPAGAGRISNRAASPSTISRSQAVIEFTNDGIVLSANANFLSAMGYTLDVRARLQGRADLQPTEVVGFQMINPATGAYAIHNGPIAGTTVLQLRSPPVYDSNTEQIYIIVGDVSAASTGYLYAYSGWSTTPTADSGTWTLLMTFAAPGAYYGRWMHYDAVTDVLFMCYREDPLSGEGYIYRYSGNPKVLVDTVTVSATDSNADVYPWILRPPIISYQSNYGYVGIAASSGSAKYLLKVTYGGPEVLYDSSGNSLREGTTDDFLNNLADSYVNYTGANTTSITGLSHLEGEEVVVWANGVDLGTDSNYEQTYTVASGAITLPYATSNVTVGLPYTARFKSSKLMLQTQTEVLFGKERRITALSLVLADTHAKGIRFGPDYDNLDDRPETDGWTAVDPDNIDSDYDADMIQFPSTWTTDLRLCLKAQAPRPCTVLAVKLVAEV